MHTPHASGAKLPAILAFLLLAGTLFLFMGGTGTQAAHAGSLPALTPAAGPTPLPGAWNIVSSPQAGWPNNYLFGVSGTAPNDIWAVGTYGNLGVNDWQLLEHWDGTGWTVSAPAISMPGELLAVTAIAKNDAWAVGGYDTGGKSLAEHWNGSSWIVVPNPNLGTLSRFFGVAAISTNNVWAVGYYLNGGPTQTLVEQWNGSSWNIVPSPSVPNVYNQLNAITTVPGSPNELWAVGTAGSSTLVEHWDGTKWSIVSSPSPGINPNLAGVTALAANDVWAVGYTGSNNGPVTLIMHWNGSAWSVVPSPNPSPTVNRLLGVAAVAANNVWAVGSFMNPNAQMMQTLMVRWNGSNWVQVIGDDAGPSGVNFQLAGVAALAANAVWAVGTTGSTLAEWWDGSSWRHVYMPNAGPGQVVLKGTGSTASSDVWQVGYFGAGLQKQTLIEHWDGAKWSISPSPNVNKRDNVLEAIVAASTSNAWAVGYASSGTIPDETTLILHWEGVGWKRFTSPSPGTAGLNELHGVAYSADNDVWAVGSFTNVDSYGQTLVEHWDGTAWSVIPSPNVPGTNNGLYAVKVLAKNDVWAVGYSGTSFFSTLAEHWDGVSWSIVPTPDVPFDSDVLYALSATGPGDVWAVGNSKDQFNNYFTLAVHWNGSSWSIVPTVNRQQTQGDSLRGVAAISASDAWAVGTDGTYPLIERWDGSKWSLFTNPNPPGGSSLFAVTAITSCDVWATGQIYNGNAGYQPLSMHFTCK